MVKGVDRTSIYDVVGWVGLVNVVWYATPYPLRLFALPYGLCVYRHILKASSNLQQLLSVHCGEYMSSRLFRLLRPRYHVVTCVLRTYGIDG